MYRLSNTLFPLFFLPTQIELLFYTDCMQVFIVASFNRSNLNRLRYFSVRDEDL